MDWFFLFTGRGILFVVGKVNGGVEERGREVRTGWMEGASKCACLLLCAFFETRGFIGLGKWRKRRKRGTAGREGGRKCRLEI